MTTKRPSFKAVIYMAGPHPCNVEPEELWLVSIAGEMPGSGVRLSIPSGTDAYDNATALLGYGPAVAVTCEVYQVGEDIVITSPDVPGTGLELKTRAPSKDAHYLTGLLLGLKP